MVRKSHNKTKHQKWRESGDWVALNNIITRGSTHISSTAMEHLKNYKRQELNGSRIANKKYKTKWRNI